MFRMFQSLIDVLTIRVWIIDVKDKPFGADLPMEIQNRIMWIFEHKEHLKRLTKVHDELKKLPMCHLTEWLRLPKRTKRCNTPDASNCSCESCTPEPTCHWCVLYAAKYLSVEFKTFEHMLERRDRTTREQNQQFITENLPRFRDILLSTAVNILLPMLVYMPPGRYHFNYRQIPSHSSFASVSFSHIFLVDGMIRETKAVAFRNAREVQESTKLLSPGRYLRVMKRKVD